MTDPMLAFLREAMDAAQRKAEAAAEETEDTSWLYDDRYLRTEREGGMVAVGAQDYLGPEVGEFMAANSPAAVLRRIAADRKQIELHAAVPDHGRFSGGGCHAACDGIHEEPPVCRSCRTYAGDPVEAPCDTVEILAEGWGWTEVAPVG